MPCGRCREAVQNLRDVLVDRLVLKNINDENAGVYRKVNVAIAGARHRPPDLLLVPEQMRDLMRWYDT